jgi:hypothetical protein
MSDYVSILVDRKPAGWGRHRGIRLTPDHTEQYHRESRAWLESALRQPFDGETVVVTHHAPSPLSLEFGRVTEVIDAAYATRLEYLMSERVALWIHGHTHFARDYTVNGTRVVSNPRGYVPADTVPEFDPGKVVMI